jgi:Flp pilus assembly protein TadB
MIVVSAVVAGLAVLLLVPGRVGLDVARAPGHPPSDAPEGGWMMRARPVLALLAGCAVAVFLGGAVGLALAVPAAATTWWLIGRVEPPSVRRARMEVRRDLPHLVQLLGAALRGGAPPGEAVRSACTALPGAAADRLATITQRLALGVDPEKVWTTLADDPELAPLGRALARAHRTGAPVVAAVERLGDELEHTARAAVEQRARAVGVRAALPLGLCLLPAFLLLGIVPLVAGLVSSMSL